MSVVAIDGPAGAGKTTIAKGVAAALGWPYVDTGAMYRALTLKALAEGIDTSDGEGLAEMADGTDLAFNGHTVLLDGRDVTPEIRSRPVTDSVPIVAAHPAVRRALVRRQRAIARDGDVVMEGRDIGSVVVPDAVLKIFLTATLDERARRRLAEVGGNGDDELNRMKRAMSERDETDSNRSESPLIRAHDAVPIDTTGRDVDDIVDEIVSLLRERTQ